jgi:hypothetical protein
MSLSFSLRKQIQVMAFFNTAFIAFLLVFTSILTNNCATAQEDERVPFYDFIAKSAEGTEIHFSRYRRSKVVLVVNVASACGYTDVNYKELQVKMHGKKIKRILSCA